MPVFSGYKIDYHRTLSVVTAPTVDAVTVSDVKKHLRIEHSDDDSYLETLIKASQKWCESYMERALIKQTLKATYDAFPSEFALPRPPACSDDLSIVIQYKNSERVVVTLESSKYRASTDPSQPTKVYPVYGKSWPAHLTDVDAVSIQWNAGYGTAPSDVPAGIRHAIMMHVGHLYENRVAYNVVTVTEVPMGVKSLLTVNSWGAY